MNHTRVPGAGNPLEAAIRSFIDYCKIERNFSSHSVKAYGADLAMFARFSMEVLGGATPDRVDRDHIRSFMQHLSERKPRTIRRKVATLRSFFKYLEQEGVIATNPMANIVGTMKVGRQIPRAASLSTIQKILTAAHAAAAEVEQSHNKSSKEAKRNVVLLELLFASGVRVAELSSLRREDIDPEEGTLRILGKGSRERMIPICGAEALNVVRRHCESMDRDEQARSWVFANRRPTSWSPHVNGSVLSGPEPCSRSSRPSTSITTCAGTHLSFRTRNPTKTA